MTENEPKPQLPRETDPDIAKGDPVILTPGEVTPGKAEVSKPDPETPLGHAMELEAKRRAEIDKDAEEGKGAQDAYFGSEVAKLGAEQARADLEVASGTRTRVGYGIRRLLARIRHR